jgi:hypothetical protein
MLWAKMTNPLPLLVLVAVWQMLRGNIGRSILHLLVIGGGGMGLFAASWLVVGRALGFPLDMPFGVNLVQWQDSAEVARRAYTSPGAFVEGLQPIVVWLGPGLVTLGLIGTALRTGQLARRWQMRGADLLIGFAIILVLGYINKTAGWLPKYQVALAPLLACLGAPIVSHAVGARPRLASGIVLVATAAVGLVTRVLVRDEWALERTWAISALAALWLVGLVGVALAVGLIWRVPAAAATVGLVGVAFGWSLGVDAVQLTAAYQTDYWYGTTGTAQAAEWVNTHLATDETYVSAKEVAIRSVDQRYVDQDDIAYLFSIGQPFDGTWAGEPLHALVIWQREPYLADLFGRRLAESRFRQEAQFGDYVIYVPLS